MLMTHKVFLFKLQLTVVLGLASLCSCATYDSIHHIPEIGWDFIIVGGGTAGSVLANRLTENPRFEVLVIEAGPTNIGIINSIVPGLQDANFRSSIDWNFTTVPQRALGGRSIAFERGRVLGGSSSVNGMVYTRGPASDYDRFAQITGDSGWSWNNLQKYIWKHEKIEVPIDNHDITGQYDPAVHSTTGKVPVTLPGFLNPAIDSAVLQASKELGQEFKFNLDMNSGKPLGLGWVQSTIGHDGTRSSAATSYLDNITRARKNLHIVTDARVTRVLRTSSRGNKRLTIRSVEVRSPNSSRAVVLTASKEVLLCAGSIGTPHILLHSGIGDESDLKALNIPSVLHNPSVGRNLSDHPLYYVPFHLSSDSIDLGPWANLSADAELQQKAFELWNTTRTGPLVRGLAIEHIAWTRLRDDSPIIRNLGDPSSSKDSAHFEYFFVNTADIYFIVIVLVSPTSRGSLMIGTPNPFDPPLIDPGYLTSKFDVLSAREGVKGALRFAKASVWKNVIGRLEGPFSNATSDEAIDAAIRNLTETGLHPTGTASMSPKNANWGVVDPDLLVKKVSGLRIVDASIMPFVPCAHTQVPTYLIAERAADMIKSTWK